MPRLVFRRLIAVLLVAGVCVALPATAVGANPTAKKIAALQKQVKALQAQVKTINSRLNLVRSDQLAGFAGSTCLGALTADLFMGTWAVIDQISAATQSGKTYFGTQARPSDFGNCALLQPTVPRPAVAVPPQISLLTPLLSWLKIGA